MSDERLSVVAVVAAAKNAVIGKDGEMPWHVPSDLKRYRKLTMGKPMIMGRKTFDSIGRVLDGRDTIILTRNESLAVEGAQVVSDPEEALARASECARSRGVDEIVIAGGSEIYRLYWDRIDRIELTEIDAEPEGDTRFPTIDPLSFKLVSDETLPRGAKDSAGTLAKSFERRR